MLEFYDVGPTLYKCYTNVLCLLGSICNIVFRHVSVFPACPNGCLFCSWDSVDETSYCNYGQCKESFVMTEAGKCKGNIHQYTTPL